MQLEILRQLKEEYDYDLNDLASYDAESLKSFDLEALRRFMKFNCYGKLDHNIMKAFLKKKYVSPAGDYSNNYKLRIDLFSKIYYLNNCDLGLQLTINKKLAKTLFNADDFKSDVTLFIEEGKISDLQKTLKMIYEEETEYLDLLTKIKQGSRGITTNKKISDFFKQRNFLVISGSCEWLIELPKK